MIVSTPTRTFERAHVVVLGAWNPAIFVPRWFADMELIPDDEAEAAQVSLVHPEIAQWDLPWLHAQVSREQLALSTPQERFMDPLRDLAVGILDLVPHTPTRMLGINNDFVLRYVDRQSFDELGWALADADRWPGLERPGMAALTMQGVRTDGRDGYLRVQVTATLDESYRVLVNVNDHYQMSHENLSSSTSVARSIIEECWRDAHKQAMQIAEHLTQVKRA
jgi:hypothetical protein